MLSGRTVLGLGCMIALAVMVGVIGASVVMGSFAVAALRQAPTHPLIPVTPTPSHMDPLPGVIDAPRLLGYIMTVEESDAQRIVDDYAAQIDPDESDLIVSGAGFFLANGTRVQILQVDGHLCRVQVMSGQHANRSGWLPVNMTSAVPPTPTRR